VNLTELLKTLRQHRNRVRAWRKAHHHRNIDPELDLEWRWFPDDAVELANCMENFPEVRSHRQIKAACEEIARGIHGNTKIMYSAIKALCRVLKAKRTTPHSQRRRRDGGHTERSANVVDHPARECFCEVNTGKQGRTELSVYHNNPRAPSNKLLGPLEMKGKMATLILTGLEEARSARVADRGEKAFQDSADRERFYLTWTRDDAAQALFSAQFDNLPVKQKLLLRQLFCRIASLVTFRDGTRLICRADQYGKRTSGVGFRLNLRAR
jgi:hypothetical protein